jgi:hypothetical protein
MFAKMFLAANFQDHIMDEFGSLRLMKDINAIQQASKKVNINLVRT